MRRNLKIAYRAWVGRFLPVIFAGILGGCASGVHQSPELVASSPESSLAIRKPKGRWQSKTTQSGKYYFFQKDGPADVVFMYGKEMPLTHSLKRVDQLFAHLSTNPEYNFEELRIDRLNGQDVIRFESFTRDAPGTKDNLVSELNLGDRGDAPEFFTRSRGVFMMHPSNSSAYVKVACSRSSYHGFIGSHYDGIAEKFIDTFVTANHKGVDASTAAASLLSSPLAVPN